MVKEPDSSDGRTLNMGDLDLFICPNNYDCETCEIDDNFFKDMKRAFQGVGIGK
jgi:hypothetical protein